jgi:hypothetical protein
MNNPNPSGATMIARGERVKDRVMELLEKYPQTRGDDLQLAFRFYRAYTGIRIKFSTFQALLMAPAPETISRRRRECQNEHPELKPTERVVGKRARARTAYSHRFGKGLTLQDFEDG